MRAAWAWLIGLCAAALAHGQEVSLTPSPAVRCMTPAAEDRGEPEYPFDPWKRNESGRVRIELSFTTPDRRPQVEVLESSGDMAFVDAVKAHVRNFRVPCLEQADIPVRLRQEYVFTPDLRSVSWTTPVDTADTERRQRMRCMVNSNPEKTPDYPASAQQAGIQGRVIAVARFVAADRPPELQFHTVGNTRELTRPVERWMQTLRMPCVGERPLDVTMLFHFAFEGEQPYGFRALSLQQFMGSVKGIRQARLALDTRTMGCPFDVRLRYQQPFLPNAVGEVGEADPRRQPLLDWLSRATLDLGPQALKSVFGDTAPIHVPCLRINLEPGQKAG